jgi:stage II sporulation protein D
MAVGSGQIRSTLLNLKNYRDKIKFVGRGWGHGVGLCQWGAKGMADKGYGYMYIINKYFPRTKIIKQL